MKKLFILALVVLGFTAVSFGQITKAAPSHALILSPVGFSNSRGLEFGTVSNLGGTVVIAPDDVTPVSGTAQRMAGPYTSALFNITGDLGTKFVLTVPNNSITLTNKVDNTKTMVVSGIQASQTGSWAFNATNGTELDVYLGGTLTVIAGQTAGIYENTTDLKLTLTYE